MSIDLGTIQYNVEADTTGIDAANAAVDNMAEHMGEAGVATDNLGKKTKTAGVAVTESAAKIDKAAAATKNLGNLSRQAGFQLQDAVVQLQSGANAALVFSQQGSQLLSVFHPMLGLVAALGGVVGGMLLSSFMANSKALDEMAENTKELTKDLNNLSDAQKRVVDNSLTFSIADQTKKYEEQTKEINKQTEAIKLLNEQQGKKAFAVVGGGFGVAGQVQQITVDNTKKLEEANRQLTASEVQRIATLKEIQALQDPSGSAKKIQSLTYEAELIGKTGREYWELKAAQDGITGAAQKQYVAIGMLNEQKKADLKISEDSAREMDRIAKKQADEEKQRAARSAMAEARRQESIEKLTLQMQREADLFGTTNKAAQLEYDILHGLIPVVDGLAGAEAQRLLVQAKRIDQLNSELDLAKQLDEEGDRARENSKKLTKDAAKFSDDAIERINGAFSGAWLGLLDNSKDAFDGIASAFKQMLAEMAHEAITKPIILNLQQSMTGGATSAGQGAGNVGSAAGAISQGGIYAAIAVAVVAGASIYNKQQDEKFSKLTAAYRQGNQSMSAILGEGTKKSDTIAKSIDLLKDVNDNVLNVNYDMLSTLIDIRAGIGDVAAGFAKTLVGSGNLKALGIDAKTDTLGINSGIKKLGAASYDAFRFSTGIGIDNKFTAAVTGFMDGITDKISNALYSKKTELADSGIGIIGNSLANILSGATLAAFSYADTKTTKKALGIKYDTSTSRQTQDLDQLFQEQITGVFENAGDALKKASSVFGIDFDSYLNQLTIKTKDLSLKGLEGDALTKEIEAFFGSTMDNWASVLLSGTSVLLDFQNIGESAFDTMLRLATETNTFVAYADKLNLNFKATGLSAVYAAESIADLSGGFDSLQASLATYYDKFFSESDKFADSTKAVTEYFADLNIAVPKTREGFKALIESLDLTTEAGQKQFSSLVSVSSAMDDYLSQLEKQKAALVDNSYSGLQRAVDAQKKILNAQIDISTKALSASQSVFDALHNTLNGLIDDSVTTQEATRRQAQNQLAGMLVSSKGGALPNIDELNRALSTISRPSENLYSTFDEYATDFYKTADVIKQLQDAAGSQISIEEKSLAALESQSLALDETLVWAKKQVDAINGVDISVLTVAQALNNFTLALGIQVPQVMQDQVNVSLAAASAQSTAADPAKIAAEQQAQAQTDTMNAMMKEFAEYVQSTQLAIVTNTDKSFRLIDKWDKTGMPPEREVL